MGNNVDEIVNRNINILKNNDNIISMFLVGSMASSNYVLKTSNDYDIRFIVRKYDSYTQNMISNILLNIQKDLLDNNYGCKVSEIIGPIKMKPTHDINILIHAITMTESDLNNLPNIHKYSYSQNYRHLYGKDFLVDYQKIILNPSDIIESTEGINYCIDLIKRRKIGFNKLINENDRFCLQYKEKDATYNDLIELYNYAYNKSLNNVLNMIKTNSLSSKIEDNIKFTEAELLLIKKINDNNLNEEDIDSNVNIIISILLKIEKVCLEIYKTKKYYNSLEWGIINTGSNSMRNKGFTFLKEIGLPTGNNFGIKFVELQDKRIILDNELKGSQYLALFEPPNNKFKRYGINVNSFQDLLDFINQVDCDLSNYRISFVEKVIQLPNSYAGTLLSDGKGNTLIETVDGTCDSRELTSTGVDIDRVKQYHFISFEDYQEKLPKELKEAKDLCQYFRGYYEFAYGSIRNYSDIYFTYYSNNEEYINIFRGGRKYGKTL